MTILSNIIYSINASPIKSPMAFFIELPQKKKKILKLVWKYKRPCIDKAILKKENRAGEIKFPDLWLYCEAIVIQSVWYWCNRRKLIVETEIY